MDRNYSFDEYFRVTTSYVYELLVALLNYKNSAEITNRIRRKSFVLFVHFVQSRKTSYLSFLLENYSYFFLMGTVALSSGRSSGESVCELHDFLFFFLVHDYRYFRARISSSNRDALRTRTIGIYARCSADRNFDRTTISKRPRSLGQKRFLLSRTKGRRFVLKFVPSRRNVLEGQVREGGRRDGATRERTERSPVSRPTEKCEGCGLRRAGRAKGGPRASGERPTRQFVRPRATNRRREPTEHSSGHVDSAFRPRG